MNFFDTAKKWLRELTEIGLLLVALGIVLQLLFGKAVAFMNSLRVGEDAPDFEMPTLEGERVRLSQLRGQKHVLLEFGSIT